jgi:hypothetical protein
MSSADEKDDDTLPDTHPGLPVAGYKPQPQLNVDRVNANKRVEETVLRLLDSLAADPAVDPRWLAIGRTHLELAFMSVNRAIFRPARVDLSVEPDADRE